MRTASHKATDVTNAIAAQRYYRTAATREHVDGEMRPDWPTRKISAALATNWHRWTPRNYHAEGILCAGNVLFGICTDVARIRTQIL